MIEWVIYIAKLSQMLILFDWIVDSGQLTELTCLSSVDSI